MKSGAPWEHTLHADLVSADRAPFRIYLFWFFLLLALPYVAAFSLVRSSAYTRWAGSHWGPMLEYSFAPGRQNADVVIFGDSSAFIGIDPRLMHAQLGIKAVLLPNTIGSLPITGEIPLERYLRDNTPPRLLVLYFSPWDLDYNHAANVRFFEGEEMMFRHGTPGEIAGFVFRHPAEVVFFPFRFYNAYGSNMVRSTLGHRAAEASVADALGHMDDRDPFPPLPGSCKLPAKLLQPSKQASVRELAQRYMARMPVLVYMAPVPACGNAAGVLDGAFQQLGAAPPKLLPAEDFVADPYFAHIEPAAVPLATRLLADAVQRRLPTVSERPVVR